MKPDVFMLMTTSILLAGFQRTYGCHNIETDQTEKITKTSGGSDPNTSDYFADVKALRRKRNAPHQDVEIVNFFPGCIQAKLAATDYFNRHWAGPVSYAVYHSSWFEEADDKICVGQNHTLECWIEQLTLFVTGLSPALVAAQRCVREYTDFTSSRKTPMPRYPPGLFATHASTCPDVDEDEYENEFKDSVNETESELESDSSVSGFADVITFARDDMICLSCNCQDLDDDDDEHSYEFEDGTDCGDCWSTRIALAVRPKSKLRGPVRQATKRRSGLTKKPKPLSSKPNSNRQGSSNHNATITHSSIAQSDGKGTRTTQKTVVATPKPVYISSVGSTSSTQTRVTAKAKTQWGRAVFVPPVGKSNTGSTTDKPVSTKQSQRQQQQSSHGSQETPGRNSEQRKYLIENSRQQQQSSAKYVLPIRRPDSSKSQSVSGEQDRSQSPTNPKDATENVQPTLHERRKPRSTTNPPERTLDTTANSKAKT